MTRRANAVLAFAIALVVVLPLWPLTHASFLNWDDDAIFLLNPPLTGASTWSWAFTTTYMGHYQPFSWLTWSAVARVFGLTPEPFHLLNLATHAMATSLIFLLAAELLGVAGVPARRAQAGSLLGALFFGVHPLRVEPVAWASAFPYLAALAFALLSVLFYVASRRRPWHSTQRRPIASFWRGRKDGKCCFADSANRCTKSPPRREFPCASSRISLDIPTPHSCSARA